MRATSLPTVQRLIMPKPAQIDDEAKMQNVKTKIMNVVKEYKHNNTEHGWPKNNLEINEIKGLKETKDKIKRKEIVVFKTDKSSK